MRLVFPAVMALGLAAWARAADQAWEVRGSFVALRPGEPEIVVIRLDGGRTLEVPMPSLSEASRAAVRRAVQSSASAAAEGGDAAVTVRGPFGRPVKLVVPASIKDLESDAIHCRTAAAAADVYRLFLAQEGLPPDQRAAAIARLREWDALADAGVVRLGERWVPEAVANAAREEALKTVSHALELMRIGNADLAEEELRKAARIDPESGRASFAMGLSYVLAARNPSKAVEHFAEAAVRQPDDGAAFANLAVLEVLTRRYGAAGEHFRRAVEWAVDPRVVAENVAWTMKLAGEAKMNPALAKNKMPERTVEEINSVSRLLTQDLQLKLPEAVVGPRFLGPSGAVCEAKTLPEIAVVFDDDVRRPTVTRRALGFAVAQGHVVCPRGAVVADDGTMLEGVSVETPSSRGRPINATVVAAPEDGAVALLRCEGLAVEPLPLATALPPLAEIKAVERSADSWLEAHPAAVTGKVLTPVLEVQARGRFVHTAVVPRGLGGGPIVDATGRVVGMVGPTPRTDLSGNAAGFGIPVERFLPTVLGNVPAGELSDGPDGTVDDDRRVVAAIVLVAARSISAPPATGK